MGNVSQHFPQDFQQNFLQDFPTRFYHNIFRQHFPATFSPQDFCKLDPDWLAPHHPIQNAKFPPITAFLKLAFSPPACPTAFPTRISCKIFLQEFPARFSHKNFPQDFPASFSPQDFPELDPDWLAPHHPIQMLNFHQSMSC